MNAGMSQSGSLLSFSSLSFLLRLGSRSRKFGVGAGTGVSCCGCCCGCAGCCSTCASSGCGMEGVGGVTDGVAGIGSGVFSSSSLSCFKVVGGKLISSAEVGSSEKPVAITVTRTEPLFIRLS